MRRRDEAEFTEFVAAVIRQLRRTAYLMCGDWHRSEDAVQDALVRLYVAWPRLDHRAGVNTYAHRAVVSSVLDQARRPGDEPAAAIPARDSSGSVDDRMLAIGALATLPPRQRACVVLRHYVDLSIDETAEALGISAGAVKSQTSRGLAVLREAIRNGDYEGTLR